MRRKDTTRKVQLIIRVTPDEKTAIDKKAAASGMNRTQYIRSILARPPSSSPAHDMYFNIMAQITGLRQDMDRLLTVLEASPDRAAAVGAIHTQLTELNRLMIGMKACFIGR